MPSQTCCTSSTLLIVKPPPFLQSEELKGFDAESDVLPQPQLVGSTGVQQPTELGSLEQVR